MIRIEPREMPSKWWTIGIPIISAFVAILLASIPLTLAGANIFEAYRQMANGIF
jgi:simple sugar transport system permease protein